MIKLNNTMTGHKEELIPLEKGKIKIFTCGPSIYRRPHIGNYRTFMFEDILVRFLELKGFSVNRIINFTDIEDKTVREAEKLQKEMGEITENTAGIFIKEAAELSIKLPGFIPSSSSSIDQAAVIIKKLIEKGHAYQYRGNIFFDPLTVENFGRLFKLDMSRWPEKKMRFKKDTYNGNRWNLGDFILWHRDNGRKENSWESIVGRGRPSWNIQDPAIITKHLGEQIDINCGGIDNIYRHHDYNIAVMEAFTDKEFAGIYLHGAHLVIDGKTMSKSRGNILYPEDIYSKGYSPGELRFFLAAEAHYRKKLNFTFSAMEKSALRLRTLRREISNLLDNSTSSAPAAIKTSSQPEQLITSLLPGFTNFLEDDLNLPEGVLFLEKNIRKLRSIFSMTDAAEFPDKLCRQLQSSLKEIDTVLCCLF